nr:phosphotransferase [Motilibacter deserti]
MTAAPLRQPWARPGGPEADLAWALDVLAAHGTPPTGPARQQRTWNLSSLWRVPTAGGAVWLKAVPSFFAHEGALLSTLDADFLPRPLAVDGHRMLLPEVPGEDQYDAGPDLLARMVRMLVGLQAEQAARLPALLALGLPDWRAEPLAAMGADVMERTASELEPEAGGRVDALIAGLETRYVAVAECGVPDSLVHGDFHPGNWRGTAERLTLLDWGDSGVGAPLLDQAALEERLPQAHRHVVRAEWVRAWREHIPGSDPARAAQLLRPVAALRQAVIYRGFLDRIEPDEHVYHAGDPAVWLRRTAELC